MKRLCLAGVLLSATTAGRLPAQLWQSGRDVPLVQGAAHVRATRDADSLLAGWQATARGILRFASVVDHGGTPIERVIRADELHVEVYGRPPNLSKQIITAWRDTTFLANTLVYHRDHLGIVSSDFGAVIRLGDGDEVGEVIHPLSPAGLDAYQFQVSDTIRIAASGGTLRVIRVDVRPVDPEAPGAIGTLYLDADRSALVQFQFTFTAASYRDATVQRITVMLENALQDNTRWLPWRQSITIERAVPWLDMPFRTVLRGDWTIDDYRLGVTHQPDRFAGRSVAGLTRPGGTATWSRPLAAELAELPATREDADALRRRAGALHPGARLSGMPLLRVAGGGLSDFLLVNRVQGVTPGAGMTISLGDSRSLQGHLGFGLSDRRVAGRLGIAHRFRGGEWTAAVSRQVRDVADRPFGTRLVNSIGTLVSGADAGDWYRRDQFVLGLGLGGLRAEVTRERAFGLASRFRALDGTQRANPDLGSFAATVVRVALGAAPPQAFQWQLEVEAGFGRDDWGRASALAAGSAPGGIEWRAEVGLGTRHLPAYRHFVLGGRGSLVGVPGRALGGRRSVFGEIALPMGLRVPTPSVGRLGLVPLATRVAPFLAVGWVGGDRASLPWRSGWEPVIGLRVDLWGPILRLEAGWSPRRGSIGFTFDAHPDWWPTL